MLEALKAVLIWVVKLSTTWTSSTRNAMFNLQRETSVYFRGSPSQIVLSMSLPRPGRAIVVL